MNQNSGLLPPSGERKILLHSCCAPCSCSIIKRMLDSGLEPTLLFYNPNIYPREEYDRRKREVIRYAVKLGVPFTDGDHESDRWFEAVKGHEEAPERGERCGLCFEMRLGKTAAHAFREGFGVFTTSLGISRWKDHAQVTRAGLKAAGLFPGLVYWDLNWRKDGGTEMMSRITNEENFYRQNYCGCLYSMQGSARRGPAGSARDQFGR